MYVAKPLVPVAVVIFDPVAVTPYQTDEPFKLILVSSKMLNNHHPF